MATIPEIASHQEQQLTDSIQDLSLRDQGDLMKDDESTIGKESGEIILAEPNVGLGLDNSSSNNDSSHRYGFCAVCLNPIVLQDTALVKGCEHAYCVTCILRWATYKKEPTCPQCKQPFEFLHVHRCLDGTIQDYMFEESVCLLLRATWFKPLIMEEKEVVYDDTGFDYNYYYEEEEEVDIDEAYFSSSSSLRIGNRRWGDNGFVRAGRQEARPVPRPNVSESSAGPSRLPKKKEAANGRESAAAVGRRAKRAMKREAADKAAAAKHQQLLVRLGRE